jgi:hypothetical protein
MFGCHSPLIAPIKGKGKNGAYTIIYIFRVLGENMNLFGFEIKKKSKRPEDKKGVVQVVVPENTDGARDVVSFGPLGGHFVEVYDAGVIDKDEFNLIKQYREMADCTEIDKALSEIINDAVTYEDNVPFPVKISLDNVELSDSIKTKIAEEFDNILYLLKFNDYGYEKVFSRQVEALANEGDLLIGISTSGNSDNVLEALKRASELGCQTLGLSGNDGGKMNTVCDLNIIIPSDNTARIQVMHILIGHILCQAVDKMQ